MENKIHNLNVAKTKYLHSKYNSASNFQTYKKKITTDPNTLEIWKFLFFTMYCMPILRVFL